VSAEKPKPSPWGMAARHERSQTTSMPGMPVYGTCECGRPIEPLVMKENTAVYVCEFNVIHYLEVTPI